MAYDFVHSEQAYMPELKKELQNMKQQDKLDRIRENIACQEGRMEQLQKKQKAMEARIKATMNRNIVKQEKKRIHHLIVFAEKLDAAYAELYGYHMINGLEEDVEQMDQIMPYLIKAVKESYCEETKQVL